MLRVGISKILIKGKPALFNYDSCEKDERGFVDASKFAPFPFDLCKLILDDGTDKVGWWMGNKFDGRKLKEYEIVISWKKMS
jgi:hypothetical protein